MTTETTTYNVRVSVCDATDNPGRETLAERGGLRLEAAFECAETLARQYAASGHDEAEFSACLREGFKPRGVWLHVDGRCFPHERERLAVELAPEPRRSRLAGPPLNADQRRDPTKDGRVSASELARRAERVRTLASAAELRAVDQRTPEAVRLDAGSPLAEHVLSRQREGGGDASYGNAADLLYRVQLGAYVVTAGGLEGEPGSFEYVTACVHEDEARALLAELQTADVAVWAAYWSERAETLPVHVARQTAEHVFELHVS